MLTRRGLLLGLAASLAAPALVRAASLDYVPRNRLQWPWVWRDGCPYLGYRELWLDGPLVLPRQPGALMEHCIVHFTGELGGTDSRLSGGGALIRNNHFLSGATFTYG